MPPLYKRVLIKLSGETLGACSIQPEKLQEIANEIIDLHSTFPIQIALVLGAGNWWRGSRGPGKQVARVSSDQIGMLATVMNAIALTAALREKGLPVLHQSALSLASFNDPIDIQKAKEALQAGSVVIFSGGVAQPFFSTDTASALRAAQIDAQVLLKATQVDGIYSQDPKQFPLAKKIATLTHLEALERGLQVMDCAAFDICKQANINIRIFKHQLGGFKRALTEVDFGSRIES